MMILHEAEYICECDFWNAEPMFYPTQELIRCKECWCWNEEEQHGCTHDMGANDFCSKAERKDEYVTLHHEDIRFIDEDAERAFYESLAERKEK